ncbi:hypothetical protein JCGZ_24182 [Jatropha curcas]|uniref:Uncharacterized protein n=1 Tax=Jatropha curcas TaxID=180498 RepID=A0A067K055_JATCU|nr:hypothetical protein JCGZ_24182 [Jatropha curcas]
MWLIIMAFVKQMNCAVVVVGDFYDYLRQLAALIKCKGYPSDVRCKMRCATYDGFWGCPSDGERQNEMRHVGQIQGGCPLDGAFFEGLWRTTLDSLILKCISEVAYKNDFENANKEARLAGYG